MKRRLVKRFFGRRYMLIFSAFIVLAVFMYLVGRSEKKAVQRIYSENIKYRREFLHDTVSNLIVDLDYFMENSLAMYETVLSSDFTLVEKNIKSRGVSFLREYVSAHNDGLGNSVDWSFVVYSEENHSVLEDSLKLLPEGWDGDEARLGSAFAAMRKVEHGGLCYVYGVLRVVIDNSAERIFKQKIHSMKFSEEGTNIVVRKMINYAGGKNYALCLIDYATEKNEGRYFSTDDMSSEEGSPLEEELYGLIKDGSTFIVQRLSDDKERQTVGFSMLDRNFDWIVTMLTRTEVLGDVTPMFGEGGNRTLDTWAVISVGVVLMLLLLAALFVCIYADQKRYIQDKHILKLQVDYDALTKANSRQFGKEYLNLAWRRFQTNPRSAPAIMFMDLDKFKYVNDVYGHEAGDLVLKGVVQKIYDTVRHSDILIRWGGDELLGIFLGLEKQSLEVFAKKLLSAVESFRLEYKGQVVEVTASAGFSYYLEKDNDYDDVVKRADNALYEAKRSGGNAFSIL